MNDAFTPLISIVMPTYNRVNYIAETIESIQGQTYVHWELLIIDDGSSDNTDEVVNMINDSRINYCREERIGMEKARNKGLEMAKGDLVAFIDSDDLWASTKLEKQVDAFNNYPKAFFCLTSGYEFSQPGKPLVYFYKERNGNRFGDLFIPFFKSEVAVTMSTLTFKKKCLQITGTLEDEEPIAHISLILNLARNFKGIILYEPLSFRRMHASSYSTINRIKRHYDGLKMIRSYKTTLPKKVFADCLFRSYINFGEDYLKDLERWRGIQQFLLSWRYRPLSVVPVRKIGKAIMQLLKQ